MCVCLCTPVFMHTWLWVPIETKRVYHILCLSYLLLWAAWCECCELNSNSVKEQQTLLGPKSSLQSLNWCKLKTYSTKLSLLPLFCLSLWEGNRFTWSREHKSNGQAIYIFFKPHLPSISQYSKSSCTFWQLWNLGTKIEGT